MEAAFCAHCGERRFDPSRHTLRHFLAELVKLATELDSRFLKSVAALAFRPGFLTREYVEGRKKKFVAPLALFAIMNVIFFFAQPLANINTFNSTLEMQQRDYLHTPVVQALVGDYLARHSDEADSFQASYNEVSEDVARTLIIVQVPLFAMLLALVRLRSGRLFYDHLVWATHFYAFQLLLNSLATLCVYAYFRLGGNDFNLAAPYILVTLVYMLFALRAAFGDRYRVAALRTALLAVAFGTVIESYRFILFLVTFALVT